MTTDYSEYFRDRYAKVDPLGNDTKFAELQAASTRKIEDLTRIAAEQAAAEKAAKVTLSGQLGLDPGGVLDRAVNIGASLYSGAANLAGNFLNAAPGAVAAGLQAHLSEEDIAALNRNEQGVATPEDLVRLNRKVAPIVGPNPAAPANQKRQSQLEEQAKAQALADQNPDSPTPLSIWKDLNKTRDAMASVSDAAKEKSTLVRQEARGALGADLQGIYGQFGPQLEAGIASLRASGGSEGKTDTAVALTKLILGGAGSIAQNPQATAEYVAENLPQLVVGSAGKAGLTALSTANVGYAMDEYNKGIQAYQSKNGGALPPLEDRQRMALQSAQLALAEQGSDLVGLSAAKLGKVFGGDVARTSLVQSLKNAAGAVAKGVVAEAPTEAYQTYLEGQIEGKPATGAEIYSAGVIGGASGGVISGGGRALSEALQITPEQVAEQGAKQQAVVDAQKLQAAAVASGDVSALVDKKNAAYSPSKAIAALAGNSALDTVAPEAKQANLVKAGEIVAELQKEKDLAEQAYATMSPEAVAGYQTKLQAAKAAGAQDEVELLQGAIDDAKDAPKQKKRLEVLTQRLTEAQGQLAQFNEGLNAGEVDVPAQVAAINTKVDVTDTVAVATRDTAVKKLLNLSMAAPEKLDSKTATALAENKDNGLTSSQRDYLRAFSAARIAENQLKTQSRVSQEIYFGGNGNLGIADHRQRVASALASGNQTLADRNLAVLQNFEADHRTKAEAAAEALARHEETGKPAQAIRNQATKSWELNTGPLLNAKQARANGAVTIHMNTPATLVPSLQVEAKAVSGALAEMKAAYAVAFSTPTSTTQGAANVQVVPQAPAPSQAAPSPQQATTPVGSPASTPGVVAGTAGGTTAAAPVVEPAGVAPAPVSESPQTQAAQASTDAVVSEPTTSTEEGQNQSTESTVSVDPKASPESVEPTSETTTEAVVEPGTLEVMGKKSPDGAAYTARNVIADFFTQTASREGDATQRPLVAMKDFLSNGWDSIMKFVQVEKLTDEQVKALDSFWEKATQWSATIQKNLFRRENPAYWAVDDLMQFFITDGEKGALQLEENIKTALSYAAYSWVAESATRPAFNTDEEINLILGRDEDTAVEEHERRLLGNVGARQNVVANTLGQRAVQALGLKASKGAPANLMPRLESAMGAHVFKLLMDEGILQRTIVSAADMNLLTGTDSKADHLFLKLARKDGELTQKAEEIFQANKGTQNILDKLFGVESALKEPTLEPVKFNQATTRSTQQGVPKKLAEIMDKENAGASYVRQDMYHLISGLDEDIVLQMAGGITTDPAEAHAANRVSNEAKNDGLLRELQRAKEYFTSLLNQPEALETPIYFEHTVWKQQRVGIATNLINPQTSKIHRHMLFRKTWETKVNMQDAAQMENFILRVAEGLGVKTDKQSNAKSLEEVTGKKLADPKIQAAAEVLMKSLAGETLSQADQDILLEGVQKGGEKMHSLDALMALAHWGAAAKAGKTEFTVQMMGEVDGVTNGPMLSHLLMGAAASVKDLFGLLNRGGFFEVGNEHNQYNLWRGAAGHFDLYEVTAGHMVQEVQALIRNGIKSKKGKVLMDPGTAATVMGAIYGFTGTLADKDGKVEKAGRDIIKTPLTAMVFGSSVGAAVESMANKFIESIYAGIEDTAKGKEGAQTTKQLIENINLLLTQGYGNGILTNLTIEQLMEKQFDADQIKALKMVFKLTVGSAVKTTMETDFAEYIKQRKQFNLAAQLSFELYDSVYQGLREELVAELIKSGDIAVNEKTGKPLHDLNAAQEGELRKRLAKMAPILDTLMSKESKSLRSGLYMAKSGKKLSTNNTFEGNVKFGTPFKDNGAKSTGTRGFQTVESAPGVSMAPMAVHSTDSAISHTAAAKGEVLNVHDAHGAGLANFEETARNLNQATWEAMLNYSPAAEMQTALSRVVTGLADLIQAGNLPPAVMTNLTAAIDKIAGEQELHPADVVEALMMGTKAMAFQADSIKFQALEQMQSVDQYALQGGNYVVTEQDRADASARRAGLSDALSAKETAAIKIIEEALSGLSTEQAPKIETPLEQDPPAPKPSVFGEVGSPKKVDQRLVDFFDKNSTATVTQVLDYLGSLMTGTSYHSVLLDMLRRSIPKDVTIKIVTPGMTAKDVKELPETPSFGWIVDKEIYLLSDGFVNSGLQTPEVLLHELTHAAVMQVIENPGRAAKVLVEDLQALMAKAKEYAQQNGITEFDSALNDVHEFVAYGMTRPLFQRMLAQISVPDSGKSSVLINGFKKLINTMTDLLFTFLKVPGLNTKAQVNTALGQLIKNVSGLANQAEKDAAKASTAGPVLSMAVNPVGVLNTYSTLDIHNALNAGGVTQEFDSKLRGLLAGIVESLHGPFGAFKAALMQNQAMTPVDVWHKALATGVAPFASSVQAAPFVLSEQEAHAMEQVEVTVRAALERVETTTTSARRELDKLFTEAQSLIKPSDFATQAEYDYIFKVQLGANGRSEHLARFAAFGLANQQVNKLLQKSTKSALGQKQAKMTIAEKLSLVFHQLLDYLHEKVTGTYAGQRADIKLNRLVENLVDIEAKKRIEIARRASSTNFLEPLEQGAKNLANDAINKVIGVATSGFIQNNSSPIVRAAGKMTATIAQHRVDAFLEEAAAFRAKHFKGRLGIIAGTINYGLSGSKTLEALLRERKILEGDRKDIITRRSKMALDAFVNGGKDIGEQASKSITQVFMRTGMHVLTDQFNLTDLENMLGNKAALDTAIAGLESQLTGFGAFSADFIHQANALAYFKVTGRNKSPVLMMNAHNIARMYGTRYVGKISEAQSKQAEPIIEKLVALYAIGYTDKRDQARAKEVLHTENTRTDKNGNGVEFVLALHKTLEQESKDRLFRGEQALMAHGYTPEIYSPHVDLVTANAADGAALVRRGYTEGAIVPNDPAHPDQTTKRLYILEGGGLMPYLTGIVSYGGMQAKGTKQHSGYMNVNTADGLANASLQADIMAGKQRSLAQGPRVDLSKAHGSFMAPVLNPRGDIVNWRYMMQDDTKDTILKRDNRFNMVLGTLAGSIFDKETVTEVNGKVFTAMKELWDAEGATKPEAYVQVGPKSTDAEAREIWNMLPEDTKAEARRIWGRDGIFVRNDSRDIIFGYRKMSLANAVRSHQERRQDAAERQMRGMAPLVSPGLEQDFENLMAKMLTLVVEQQLVIWARTKGYPNPEQYGERAAILVAKGERMWQEIVGETKDLLVIKTITVMMGNLKSNLSLLVLSGVPLKDIYRDHVIAWRGATSYQRDSDEMDRLQTLLDTKQTNGKDAEIRSQIARLQDSIDRNPVKELIEAGLMPTIVEDAAADEDIYSYKSALVQLSDKVSAEVHPLVKDSVRNVYLAKDTFVYKGLRQITQLSDFMARYTQYQYLTTRKENPLSKADAIQQASDDFINYDIPMHRGMQYLDDMGIMPFMKYFLRIQKVLGRLAKDSPARVLAALSMGQFLDLGPIVLDSSWVHHLGNNPLHTGALQYPGALSELATVSGAMELIK